MKSGILSMITLLLISVASAQSPRYLEPGTDISLNDGHTLRVTEKGTIVYDNRFEFRKYEDQSLMSEHYTLFYFPIVNERGEKDMIYAALETQEADKTGKVWFTIYEGPLGGMRQAYVRVSSTVLRANL